MTRPMTWPMTCALFSSLLVLTGMLSVNLASPAAAALPSKSQWVSDTYTAMDGSRSYTARRVQRGGSKLAINFDIDNTSLASHYDYGSPVAATLRFAKDARAHGVTLLFNTGRERGNGAMSKAASELSKAGYVVTEVCGRAHGEGLSHSKQRCRQHFVDEGYTLIANVGNRSTDFDGVKDYEKAFTLPNYGNQLS